MLSYKLKPDPIAVGKRRLPAWLLSAGVHAVALIVLALATPVVTRGVGDEADRQGGIVLVKPGSQAAEYWSDADDNETLGGESASGTDSPVVGTNSSLPSGAELPFDVAGMLPSGKGPLDSGIGPGVLESLPGAGQMTRGPKPSRKLGGKGSTYVFGVEGEGTSFVYLFDRSNSMNGYQGRPLAAAKSQLIQSLQSLESVHQFQIIFYNDTASALNPFAPQRPRVLFATEANKEFAEDFVRHTKAFGSTRHMQALTLALRLAPDVIFFLTDAAEPQLTGSQLEQLRRLNSGTVIHAIEFGEGPFIGGDNFLMRLARQNDGQHRYVDVTQLR